MDQAGRNPIWRLVWLAVAAVAFWIITIQFDPRSVPFGIFATAWFVTLIALVVRAVRLIARALRK